MSVVTNETVTTFYYKINSLIDRVNFGVLYKARNRADILGLGGNSVIDAEILVKEYLHSIAAEIFSKQFSPLGRGLANLDTPQEPFEFDATFMHPETEAETEGCIIFRVIFPDKFDATTKPSVYKALEDTIVSYAVYNWIMDSNIQDWQKYEMEHLRKMDILIDLITRRINLKRTYKEF